MHRVPVPTNEQAPEASRAIFNEVQQKTGSVLNFMRVVGYKPDVLKAFLAFYPAVVGKGAVDQKTKEFAYMKTSMVNRCDY